MGRMERIERTIEPEIHRIDGKEKVIWEFKLTCGRFQLLWEEGVAGVVSRKGRDT